MKRLLTALIAAGFASATVGALAVEKDKPYTAKPQAEKPGRAADDAVKSGPVDKPAGRAADEEKAKKKKKKEQPKEQPK